MTPEDLEKLCARIEFDWPLKQWNVRVKPAMSSDTARFWGGTTLNIHADTPHRDTGNPGPFYMGNVQIPSHVDMPQKAVVEQIKRVVCTAMIHEVEESMKLDGVRIFDPHAKEVQLAAANYPAEPKPGFWKRLWGSR